MSLFVDRDEILKSFENPQWDEDTGECWEKLQEGLDKLEKNASSKSDRIILKSQMVVYILDHAQIAIDEHNIFAFMINHHFLSREFYLKWLDELNHEEMSEIVAEASAYEESYICSADPDFGHTSPDWRLILSEGIPGMKERLNLARDKAIADHNLTKEKRTFFQCSGNVIEAVVRIMKRMSEAALRKNKSSRKMQRLSECLLNLTEHAPSGLYEVMQFSLLMYIFLTQIEKVLIRSMGRMDWLYDPFFRKDMDEDRLTIESAEELFSYYFCTFNAIGATANMPFTLCGEDEYGNDVTSELTYLMLRTYIGLNIYDPKMHIRWNEHIPTDILKIVCEAIRKGNNSFVFVNDNVAVPELMSLGQTKEEARTYSLVGCYEPFCPGREIPCSCNGIMSLPKILECLVNNGVDPLTGNKVFDYCLGNAISFDAFYHDYLQACRCVAESVMRKISAYESYYMKLCPSPMFSVTIPESTESGRDVYQGSARYNNSSINAIGLSCTVDSLFAVKALLFDGKCSVDELRAALSNNWEGYEKLRTQCLHLREKYGNGIEAVDTLTADLVHHLSEMINNKPNGRNGKFRFGTFSIDWGFKFGLHLGALPDGRMKGEPIPKNYCPSVGMDKNGITGLIRSVTNINAVDVPNGSVLDLIIHPSFVSGNKGLQALQDLISVFMKRNGFAIQFNVFDADMLREAQKHPEKYATLQVRVCGWNAYFIDLSVEEQNLFIRQAEEIS